MTNTRPKVQIPDEAAGVLLWGLGSLTALAFLSMDRDGWDGFPSGLTNTLATSVCLVSSIAYWYNFEVLHDLGDTAYASAACGAMSYIIYRGFMKHSFPQSYVEFFVHLTMSAHAAFHLEVWNGWCTRLLTWVTTSKRQQGGIPAAARR